MAWLTNWNYRKSITLSRASGAVTNYQMKLLVGESAGLGDVDCAGHVLSSFNDLRFTASDGTTVLDYWIESISGTTPNQVATVWIEFNSIGIGATTFYMYYGNASATAVSSGANTFIVFDNFERGNNGDTVGGAWAEDAVHVHISTDQDIGNVAGFVGTRSMKLIGQPSTACKASIPVTSSVNIAIRYRYYKEDACAFVLQHGDGAGANDLSFYMDANEDVRVYDGATFVDTTLNCLKDAWGYVDIHNFNWSGGTVDVEVDGNTKTGCDITYASAGDDNVVRFYGGPNNTNAWIDDFLVRNYRSTEPTWGSWGSEEPGFFTLSVDNLAHANSLDAFALTQVHNLAIDALAHANAIDNVVLSQIHQLVVQALSHVNIIENIDLIQAITLVVDALTHGHSLGAVNLFQNHLLIAQALQHTNVIDEVSLSQVHSLIVQALQHVHTIGILRLSLPVPENFVYQKLRLQTEPIFAAEGGFSFRSEKMDRPEPSVEGSLDFEKIKLATPPISKIFVWDVITWGTFNFGDGHTYGEPLFVEEEKRDFSYQQMKRGVSEVEDGTFEFERLQTKAVEPAASNDFKYRRA